MKRSLFVLVVLLLIAGALCADAERPTVKIAAFNILRLGQEAYDEDKDWDKTVQILAQFDIVALTEVIDASAENISESFWRPIPAIPGDSS